MRSFRIVVVMSLLIATAVSGLIVMVAWEHNPMQAYVERDDSDHIVWVDWSYLLLLFGSWFVPTFGICMAVGSVPLIIMRLVQKRRRSIRKNE